MRKGAKDQRGNSGVACCRTGVPLVGAVGHSEQKQVPNLTT